MSPKKMIGLSLRLRAQTLRGFCQQGLFAAGLRLRDAEDHARCLGAGLRVRGDGFGDERVAADDGVCADDGLAAEDGRAGVDRGVVADGRVALSGHGVTVARTERAERHALIELDVVADDRRLADDDAGAVVDEEVFADLGAGVDVDTGRAEAYSLMMRGMSGTPLS